MVLRSLGECCIIPTNEETVMEGHLQYFCIHIVPVQKASIVASEQGVGQTFLAIQSYCVL